MSNQRGYTLIEVLVVTLIGLAILWGFTSIYLSGQGTLLQSTVQLQSQRDGTLIVDEFALRGRAAHSATITGGGSGVQFRDINGANTYLFASGGAAPVKFLENGNPLTFSQVDSLAFSASGQQVTMGLVLSDKYRQKLRIITAVVMRN